MKRLLTGVLVGLTVILAGCGSKADVASENISTAADQFQVLRRVIFVNGITGDYLLTIEGYCSINDQGNQLEVTCKVPGEGSSNTGGFKKHFLGLSDNVTYFVEQMAATNVSVDHYKVVFRPSTIIPDIDAN